MQSVEKSADRVRPTPRHSGDTGSGSGPQRHVSRSAGEHWRRRRPGFWAITLAFTAVTTGGLIPTPLYGIYADEFGFSTSLITVIFAAYSLGTLSALLLFGQLSDVSGRRPLVLAGIAVGIASAMVFIAAEGLVGLLVARALSGLSIATVAAAATAYLTELVPNGDPVRASRIATGANLGGLGFGALLAGVLAEFLVLPTSLVFWVHLGLLAVAALLVYAAPETVKHSERRGRLQRLQVPAPMRGLFVKVAFAVTAAFAFFGLFSALPGRFVHDELGSPSLVLVGATAFSMFAAAATLQFLVSRLGGARSMRIGLLLLPPALALLVGALAATQVVLFVAAAVVGGAGGGLTFAGGLSQLNEEAPAERRGEVMASILLVAYTALSVPVLGLGLATQVLSVPVATYAFAAAVTVLALVGARPHGRKRAVGSDSDGTS